MLPRKKSRQPLHKRRCFLNRKSIKPRRLDFSQAFVSDIDDESDTMLLSDDDLTCTAPMNKVVMAQNIVIKPPKSPKLRLFDLTAWRPCKIMHNDADDFFRLAHLVELDGRGSEKAFNITLPQMRELIYVMLQIDEAFASLQECPQVKVDFLKHICSKVHVRVHDPYKCLNIRVFEQNSTGVYPTAAGIALRLKEWDNLKSIKQDLEAILDEAGLISCDHANQMAESECPYCSPYPEQQEAAGIDSDY